MPQDKILFVARDYEYIRDYDLICNMNLNRECQIAYDFSTARLNILSDEFSGLFLSGLRFDVGNTPGKISDKWANKGLGDYATGLELVRDARMLTIVQRVNESKPEMRMAAGMGAKIMSPNIDIDDIPYLFRNWFGDRNKMEIESIHRLLWTSFLIIISGIFSSFMSILFLSKTRLVIKIILTLMIFIVLNFLLIFTAYALIEFGWVV